MARFRDSIAASTLTFALALSPSFRSSTVTHAAQAENPSIIGAWSLDKDLSDKPPEPGPGEPGGRGGRGGPGGRGSGGGRGGGRGGGGFGMGGGMGRGAPPDREEMERLRDARRAIFEAPERITIVQSDSTVIITSADGRTTRLATDGTKVKDESTGITRKTRWEGGKLVTEITGAGPGKTLETYSVAPDTGNLTVTISFDGDDKRPPVHHVYTRSA